MRRLSLLAFAAVTAAGPMFWSVSAQSAPAKSTASPPAQPAVQYVRVDGADYTFNVPATVKTGLTVFNLVNVGRDNHAMTVLTLPAGKTLKQFLDTFHSTGKVPAWSQPLGETGTIKAGTEAFVTARLTPGRYVLACLIPAADGRSHTEKGMVQMVVAK